MMWMELECIMLSKKSVGVRQISENFSYMEFKKQMSKVGRGRQTKKQTLSYGGHVAGYQRVGRCGDREIGNGA